TGPILPTSASGYSMASRSSSVPQSDSLYSVSSGGSSISSTSCSSDGSKVDFQMTLNLMLSRLMDIGFGISGPKNPRIPWSCEQAWIFCIHISRKRINIKTTFATPLRGGSMCCGGHCLGAYPRQPTTGAIRRSQQHAMKMRLQDYCRPSEKNHVNRLPPIRELPGQSPLHNTPPASTRIRCAQKIVTQLELPLLKPKGYKYEKLPQDEEDETAVKDMTPEREKRWWSDKKRDRTKSEERIDNKKNEIAEKQMELKEKLIAKADKQREKNKKTVNEERL
ncbi:hypothetical protein NQ318_021788, partial [Aromia moschata]